jgi:hypothetical protein
MARQRTARHLLDGSNIKLTSKIVETASAFHRLDVSFNVQWTTVMDELHSKAILLL